MDLGSLELIKEYIGTTLPGLSRQNRSESERMAIELEEYLKLIESTPNDRDDHISH